MKSIYKYELAINDFCKVLMPHDAKIIKVGFQNVHLFIWAEVDNDSTCVDMTFRIYGTGHELDYEHEKYQFVDTAFDPRGLVWHIYKV